MKKAYLKEENPEKLQKMIDERKCELEKLLMEKVETEKKLIDTKKTLEKLHDLTYQCKDEIYSLEMQIEIAKCEIKTFATIQKNLKNKNINNEELRVFELQLILLKQKYEMKKLSNEETKIKDSLVSCQRKDAKMWNARLNEKTAEINNLSMDIEKTKMQLEFAIALQKKSEDRKN